MSIAGSLTLLLVFALIGLLIATRIPPDLLLIGGLTVLMAGGVLTPSEALKGFSNQGMITVGVLYVVVCGFRETGGIFWIANRMLGQPKSLISALFRLMAPTTFMSAFLNNTPVVAMLIPAVNEWAKKNRLPVSKLMIPLSYAAILGGTCTLIGTSTNLVVHGLMISSGDFEPMPLFSIAWVGVPCVIVGFLYIFFIGQRLLPDRLPAISELDDPREYTIEMIVEEGCPLIGQTIEGAGLRNLPGTFLVEINRDDRIIPAVSPQERLRANDRLVFAGIIESVIDLQKIRGLIPATNQVFKLDAPRNERTLIETVVSNTCPIVGKTIRDGRFRNLYNAVIIAVARNGERIKKKIGDIVLQPGDTLLLEAHPSFVDQQRNSRDFFLVSRLENSQPPRYEKAYLSIAILAAMVFVATFGWLSMLKAAFIAAILMLACGCCSMSAARSNIDWQVLIVIAGSFGIGAALAKTGAAAWVAESLIAMSGGSPWVSLAVVYLVTTVFTELITNNAAAVLVYPIALSAAGNLGVSFIPFAFTIMMAASASFSSPIGYQTNLMVYGPGGYYFSDYAKIGIPLNILMGITTVLIAPLVWHF